MKTRMLLMAALVGAAAISANAGVRFGFSIGLPLPVIITTPAVVATTVPPAPAVLVQTVPACPGVNYVWVPGYWSYCPTGHTWMPGAWRYRPLRVERGHFYAGHRR